MQKSLLLLTCFLTGLVLSAVASADNGPSQPLGTVQVTATPMPENMDSVPQSLNVVTHDQLMAQGATDLRSALELSAGVDIAPGGDSGPAGAVPEFQGLREFDAFLLLVDGIPVGGAFDPDLPSIDLNGVDRIEVIRGSAPVKYGATSFVGVINVIHKKAGAPGGDAELSYGSYGSKGASIATALGNDGPVRQSVFADYTQQGYSDPRESWNRSHVMYRSAVDTDDGEFRLDLDGVSLHQKPPSPVVLPDGVTALSPLVQPDDNDNPSDAEMDEDRMSLTLGKDTDLKWAQWTTTLSNTFTHNHIIRGFIGNDQLTQPCCTPNSQGYNQSQDHTDVYFDSHLTFGSSDDLKFVTGVSYLYGSGLANSANFAYWIAPSGVNAPASTSMPVTDNAGLQDQRKFFGAYAQTDWVFAPRWDFNLGLQLNRDLENLDATDFPTDPTQPAQQNSDHRSDTRFSDMVSLGYAAWTDGVDDTVIYGNYRNTFKPAAQTFDPGYSPGVLAPETAQAYEVGAKGTLAQAKFDWEVSLFLTNMANTVISTDVGGLPGTANGGTNRFQGLELSGDWKFADDWRWQTAYSYHDAHYTNFINITPAGLVQDAGHRLEVSPHHLFTTAVFYMPDRGWQGSVLAHYTGQRFFDPENTVSTPAFWTYDASLGYRFTGWTLRLDGRNLSNARNPISNSELGNSESYVLPARFFELSASFDL